MATPVSHRMSRHPVKVSASLSSAEARRIAQENDVHHLLVEQAGAFVGVVCLCNLDAARPVDSVESCMRIPTFISETGTAEEAAETMRLCGIGCLPVVNEEGRLVGLVTRHDVIDADPASEYPATTRCAACGSRSVTAPVSDGSVAFCDRCLQQVTRDAYDDIYFTVGGGD